VLQASVPQYILVVILVLSSVVSAAYYLAVVSAMFMRPRKDGASTPITPALTNGVVMAMTIALLVLGIYPTPVVLLARVALPQSLLVGKPPSERVTPAALFRSASFPAPE
jgi:NADH-quinone oxidoreductase subunit N